VKADERRVAAWLRTHDGLITLSEAMSLGLSQRQIRRLVDSGRWQRLHRGVYRACATPRTSFQLVGAACLAAGPEAVASHSSAAWLWGLIDRPPARPEITVPTNWRPRLRGVRVHRSGYLDPARSIVRSGVPTTDPLRTLVDLGAVLPPTLLVEAVDRALAARLATVRAVLAELGRLSGHGRPGVRPLRRALEQHGLTDAPHPSVLESRTVRLLRQHHLAPDAVEVAAGPDGEYRLDFAFPALKLAVEVDGYAWHSSPEHQRRDHHRRNRLHASGWRVLVYTWLDVLERPAEMVAEIEGAKRWLRPAEGPPV
jgi:very-short-patch-repair endonuclease